MKLNEATSQFIQTWGRLGGDWGVNRTMAQIHALLLTSTEPLNTDEVMKKLQVSRGNANANLRALVEWGLISKVIKVGDRREYFHAEKNVWKIARAIAVQRHRREIKPMLETLENLLDIEEETSNRKEAREFKVLLSEFLNLGKKATRALNLVTEFDQKRYFEIFKKFF